MGIEADDAEADRWMLKASELGHTEATYHVGRKLLEASARKPKGRRGKKKREKGLSFDTGSDAFKEALAVLQRAARLGHEGASGLVANFETPSDKPEL